MLQKIKYKDIIEDFISKSIRGIMLFYYKLRRYG